MIKILTNKSVENTNIDGARANHFSAGMKSGIVKGALNEGNFFASSSNVIALDSCELRMSGHQVVIDTAQYITLSNSPSKATRYSLIAEIKVDDGSVPTFRLFVQSVDAKLTQDNLFKTLNGVGTYQLCIGNFTFNTNGTITDVVRTADLITGGSGGDGTNLKVGKITTNMLDSDLDAEVDVEFNEETGCYDLTFNLPKAETKTRYQLFYTIKTSNALISFSILSNSNSPMYTYTDGVYDITELVNWFGYKFMAGYTFVPASGFQYDGTYAAPIFGIAGGGGQNWLTYNAQDFASDGSGYGSKNGSYSQWVLRASAITKINFTYIEV